jgi:hypothetical protein
MVGEKHAKMNQTIGDPSAFLRDGRLLVFCRISLQFIQNPHNPFKDNML